MRYLITISYDGSKFNGLQKLPNLKTVQGELEEVLTNMNQKFVSVKAAGRTDKGVHALNQKCHFELDKETTPYKLRYYINNATSKGLYVKNCEEIEDDYFHARFSVKSKSYMYKINMGEYDPINDNYLFNYNKKLNIEKIKDCAKCFLGGHNFKVFVTDASNDCNSIIDFIDIKINNDILEIRISGKAFYTHMIRNIVGVLILAGENKITKEDIIDMLNTGVRLVEYKTAPPNGLYLENVIY